MFLTVLVSDATTKYRLFIPSTKMQELEKQIHGNLGLVCYSPFWFMDKLIVFQIIELVLEPF